MLQGGGKSRRLRPMEKQNNFFRHLGGQYNMGHFATFFSYGGGGFLLYGGLFAIFFSIWGAFLLLFLHMRAILLRFPSYGGPICYFFLHVGAFFVFMGGLFWAAPPPTKIPRGGVRDSTKCPKISGVSGVKDTLFFSILQYC